MFADRKQEKPKMKARTLGVIMYGLLAFAGCGTSSAFMPLNPPPHPVTPRPPGEVQMFTNSAPARPYVEVGLITAAIKRDWSGAGDLEIIDALRDEAAKHGCDGVVVTGENKLASGTSNSITGVTVKQRTAGYRAVCIVFNDGAPTAFSPPPPAPAPAPVGYPASPMARPAAAPL